MRPKSDEAAPYYFTYIDRVTSDDIVSTLRGQLDETTNFLSGISDEKSLHRYGADKWSIRELMSHVNDTERIFTARALWFARGFEEPLPSFDQNICVAHAAADDVSWGNHIDEFRAVRSATIELFRNLSSDAWDRSGIASDNRFTVRALAYITAGHVSHHLAVIRERYL
jgi:hypothetical protein